MADYRQEREKQQKIGTISGIALAVGLHLCLAVYGTFSGIKYLYPPPQEQTFLIDFTEEKPEPVKQNFRGQQPRAEDVDKKKSVELVQASEAQEVGKKNNVAEEAAVDDFGDVDRYEPPREKEIDKRALFHAADNKAAVDTLAAQTAAEISEKLREGHASGNTESGKTSGEPNAHLKGRKATGVLPRPAYKVQEEGIVVVTIWVDQYGKVTKAVAGADGTTVNNRDLWNAARTAALGTHFNQSADAPALQQGTITYKFNLR